MNLMMCSLCTMQRLSYVDESILVLHEYVYFAKAIDKSCIATKAFYEKDLILSRVVLAVTAAVLTGSEADVDAEKEKFMRDAKSPSKASSSGFPTVSALGATPPTATLQDLKPLADLKTIPNTIWQTVQEREDYKPIRDDLVKALSPVKDLIKSIKERVNSMKTRKAALKEEKGKRFGDLSAPSVLHNFLHMCLSLIVRLLRE